METDTVSLPRTGSDIYMYSDVTSLYMGRSIAKQLEEKPNEIFTKFMETWKNSQKKIFYPLIDKWIKELESHPDPVGRLIDYLTTLKDEGQQFRSCAPFYAFKYESTSKEYLRQAMTICDEFWTVRKTDIPA